MNTSRASRVFVLLLVAVITFLFIWMIRRFLITLLLAAIFAGLAHPLYRRMEGLLRGRRGLASFLTILLLLVVVLGPLLTLLGVIAAEAFEIKELVEPWINQQLAEPGEFFDRIPGTERLEPYRKEILTKAGEMVGSAGAFVFRSVSATTRGTVAFFFQFFLFLYSMFFFLMDGGALLRKILYYSPLDPKDENRLVEKFTSVSRATIKGTLFIGVLQGSLAGVALWIAGISGPVFWGTVMTFLSIVPGVGTALVWVPAALILLAKGSIAKAIFLAAFCSLVVGSVDNLLRPRLVGRDTQMHDLLILFATLGGLLLFGVLGFIVGPILAALFVTVWEIYGEAFGDLLPGGGKGDEGR